MKRICLVGAALAALLTAGFTSAAAAKPAAATHKKTKQVAAHVSCKLAITTAAEPGETAVLQGAGSGTQFGSAGCGAPLYKGIERTIFTTNADGTIVGKFQQWFNSGSVYGTFKLTPLPSTGPPTGSTFAQQDYTGTLTFKGGTGTLSKTVGKGTLKCSSPDQAHYACTQSAKLSVKATG